MFETVFIKNETAKTLVIERQFDAPRDKVWHAWTNSEMLEQWWAPKPWKAVTEDFSFKEGGRWFYYMHGPEGEKHWSLLEYQTIKPQEIYTAVDAFADAQGNKNTELPVTPFKTEFMEADGRTKVRTISTFQNLEDMNKLLEMGMAEGMAMGYRSLDELLAKK